MFVSSIVIWAVLVVVFLVAEAGTVALVSIWFALGAPVDISASSSRSSPGGALMHTVGASSSAGFAFCTCSRARRSCSAFPRQCSCRVPLSRKFPREANSRSASARTCTVSPAKRNEKETPLFRQITAAIENTPKLFPRAPMVACQGVEGAYSQLACEKIFPS